MDNNHYTNKSLYVNIDHVATLRNVRDDGYPNLLDAANEAVQGGASGITIHLREDRRHIKDEDVYLLRQMLNVELSMEIAPTDEMVKIASDVKPAYVCFVPEKREELTTEGGLHVSVLPMLPNYIDYLKSLGIKVSLFLEPDVGYINEYAAVIGKADIVELHTGAYARAIGSGNMSLAMNHLYQIRNAAQFILSMGLECHAGHGLNFSTVRGISDISEINRLHIGHFLISDSLLRGLRTSVREMLRMINSVA